MSCATWPLLGQLTKFEYDMQIRSSITSVLFFLILLLVLWLCPSSFSKIYLSYFQCKVTQRERGRGRNRVSERDRESSTCWFTRQLTAMARTGPDQEQGASSYCAHGSRDPGTWISSVAFSECFVREQDRRRVAETQPSTPWGCQRHGEWLLSMYLSV